MREEREARTGVERRHDDSEDWCFGYLFIKTAVAWPLSAVSALFIMLKSKGRFSALFQEEEKHTS